MDQKKIGEFIAHLRKDKELTQAEFGEMVGVTGKAVSRWERGQGLPDISIVNKVSEILGVTTTELLNGEKLAKVTEENIDEITESSVEFHTSKLSKKFKKIVIILVSFIVALIGLLLIIFCVNNYNKCRVYSIKSKFSDVELSGTLTITNNNNSLVLSKFGYNGTSVTDVYAIEYTLMIGNKTIDKGGSLSDYILSNNSNTINIRKYFETINIYLDNLNDNDINNLINNKAIYIHFKYIGRDDDEYEYDVPLKLTKEFSNSNLIYFN